MQGGTQRPRRQSLSVSTQLPQSPLSVPQILNSHLHPNPVPISLSRTNRHRSPNQLLPPSRTNPHQHSDVPVRQELRTPLPPNPIQIDPPRPLRRLGQLLSSEHPRQPIGPISTGPSRQQIPPLPHGDQPNRIDSAPRRPLTHRRVVNPQLVPSKHRPPNRRHRRRGHILDVRTPREQIDLRLDKKTLRRITSGSPMRLGQSVDDLAHGRRERRSEPEHLPGTSGQQGKRLVVVQPGQLSPKTRQQREPTMPAARSVDRHTRRRQRLDVPQHGASGHLQLPRERGRGQLTVPTQ